MIKGMAMWAQVARNAFTLLDSTGLLDQTIVHGNATSAVGAAVQDILAGADTERDATAESCAKNADYHATNPSAGTYLRCWWKRQLSDHSTFLAFNLLRVLDFLLCEDIPLSVEVVVRTVSWQCWQTTRSGVILSDSMLCVMILMTSFATHYKCARTYVGFLCMILDHVNGWIEPRAMTTHKGRCVFYGSGTPTSGHQSKVFQPSTVSSQKGYRTTYAPLSACLSVYLCAVDMHGTQGEIGHVCYVCSWNTTDECLLHDMIINNT